MEEKGGKGKNAFQKKNKYKKKIRTKIAFYFKHAFV